MKIYQCMTKLGLGRGETFPKQPVVSVFSVELDKTCNVTRGHNSEDHSADCLLLIYLIKGVN